MRQRRIAWGLALLVLTLPLGVRPAGAALPDGTLVVAKGTTVDAAAMPLLFTLAEGTYSAVETGARFAVASHQASDWLVVESGELFAHVLEPGSPPPIAEAAYYFDPEIQATLPVRVVPDAASSFDTISLRLPDGSEQSLATLLDVPGSAAVFSLPEPDAALALALGGLELAWLAHRRRSRSDRRPAGGARVAERAQRIRDATRSTAASTCSGGAAV